MGRVYFEGNKMVKLHATKIDGDKYDKLFAAWENGKAPESIWYMDCDDYYIGIDNYDGDFYVEAFKSLDDCIKWLEDGDMDAWDFESYI